MRIQDRYRLEFRWQGLEYDGDVATFTSAWFTGPVLKYAEKIQPLNDMSLDFTQQNRSNSLFVPRQYYIARLSWGDIIYRDNEVLLDGCKLNHQQSGTLKNLKDGFYFVIDCSKHEAHMHRKILVYPAWALTQDNYLIK